LISPVYIEDAARVIAFRHLGVIGAALYPEEALSGASAGSDR
jgi:hypothetical protein